MAKGRTRLCCACNSLLHKLDCIARHFLITLVVPPPPHIAFQLYNCLWLVNMTSAGEKQHYALVLLERLFNHLPSTARVGVLYDIGCQLHRSVELGLCNLSLEHSLAHVVVAESSFG